MDLRAVCFWERDGCSDGIEIVQTAIASVFWEIARCPKFRKDAVNFAKTYVYDDVLLGGLHVRAGDHTRYLNHFVDDGFSGEQIESLIAAWQSFDVCSNFRRGKYGKGLRSGIRHKLKGEGKNSLISRWQSTTI